MIFAYLKASSSNRYGNKVGLCMLIAAQLLLSPFHSFGQKQALKFKNFSTSQGLSQSNVTAIIQDSKGFMWFATRGGLNKYDGYTFTTYINDLKNEASISSNSIRDIIEDHQGHIWIATLDEGLNCYDRATNRFIRYKNNPQDPNSLSSNCVDKVYVDRKGNLWIGTLLGGLDKFDQKSNRFIHYRHDLNNQNSISDDAIYDILEDRQGNLWIGTEKGGLNLYNPENQTFTSYQHHSDDENSLSSNFVRDIFEDSRGELWIGTDGGGLNRFDQKKQQFIHYKHDSGQHSLSHNIVLCVSEDGEGNIWAGTENGGINVWNRRLNTFSHYFHDSYNPHSINSNSIYAIHKDNRNNMWIGTYSGGVNFLEWNNPKFETFAHVPSDPNSLNHNNVLAFAEDREGNIWIGTDGGGLNLFDRTKQTFTHFLKDENDHHSLSGNYVVSVITDQSDNIWAATWMDGLNYFDKTSKKFTRYLHNNKNPHSLSFDGTWVLHEDRNGGIWLGTIGGGLEFFNKTLPGFVHYTHQPLDSSSLIHNKIHYVLEDSKGNLWIGTDVAGLDCFDRKTGRFTHYKHASNQPQSISNNIINCITEDSKGQLWIGTNAGLNRFDYQRQTFEVFLEKETVKGVLEDGHGNLWISSNNGLHKFNPVTGSVDSYFVSDGLQSNEFNYKAFFKTHSGEMLFGGTNGFTLFHPDSIRNNSIIPPIIITDFSIFNQPVEIGAKDSPLQKDIAATDVILLSYKESVFSFGFTALNYSQPEKNQYAYQMVGFDRDWNYVGNHRTATYTNLDPGEYLFKVKASNNDGIWNEQGTSVKIIITPPFWQTWWFRLLISFSIAGGAVLFYLARIRTIKARQIELEKQVKERTAEVLEQKEEIQMHAEKLQTANHNLLIKQEENEQQRQLLEKHRNSLKETNNKIISSITYAKTIQQAILPSSEQIRQVLPEHFILFRPKDVVSGDFYWLSHLLKDELEGKLDTDVTFLAAIDCTGHGVPGAFMSIIGHTLLNEIVNLKRIMDPAQILEELDRGVCKAVEKTEGVGIAGMDLCLVRIQQVEENRVKILYAGAKRSLLYVNKGSNRVEKLEADRYSIGSRTDKKKTFTNQELILEPEACLYLDSDGYADQNNPARQRLGTNRLYELILQAMDMPLDQQKKFFEQALDAHQQEAEQRDDITLLGIRL